MCTRPVQHPAIPLLMEASSTAAAIKWALSYLGVAAPLVERPAVVLDIDGTVVINGEDGQPRRCQQHVRRLAAACASAGLAVFFVTARADVPGNRQRTLEELERFCGIVEPDGLFLRKPGSEYGGYKRHARSRIRGRGYSILLSVGDQFADLSEAADDLDLADDRIYVGQLGDAGGFGIKLRSEFR